MLRAARRALPWVRAEARALVCGPAAGAAAGPQLTLRPLGNGLLLQAVRNYADKKPVTQSSQMDDLPSSMLLKDYQNVPGIDRIDDIVKRLLSLEMANQKEKMKIKTEQLLNKMLINPEDTKSLEARVTRLTVKIHNYEEHMQKHRKVFQEKQKLKKLKKQEAELKNKETKKPKSQESLV
ncbi:28S ribosomal protein S15, mitochondrial isoform X2 [Monodelphis domestica]|uniref:28S ribosomal protein S15, mitochondrial isoform X2 n=1 Tax=Monodelphis domestica TaxID=13616 RepID=UPI000443437D|nr:28S ribosomal protein S15, mitochondrial isoform X2 [Monodelphis domestica]